MYSLVIPVYKNEGSLDELLLALGALNRSLGGKLEVVFVVDGSPDACFAVLRERLPACCFASRLVLLSRNFGSFAAIREGLRVAHGPLFAVMAADLQEPPELVERFFRALEAEPVDVVYGEREARADSLGTRLSSNSFWWLFRRLVNPAVPAGGVDVFGCNTAARDTLVSFIESNSSLVGQLFWMGYRRKGIRYGRLPRKVGKSAWTLGKKVKYLSDSLFAFSDLPIRVLAALGAVGLLGSTALGLVVLIVRLGGTVPVPGYAATVLTVIFFAALNSFGLGIVGSYVWRTFENTKGRPLAIVMRSEQFVGANRVDESERIA